jgi:N-acetylneuraminic acid mutarotase
MAYVREEHTATLLNNGQVLLVGTLVGTAGRSVAELYDPTSNTWSTSGTMAYGRYDHAATLLNNGHVLVTGQNSTIGDAGGSIAEIYDPATNTWSIAGTMAYPRYLNTSTLLNNGQVLVVGTLSINAGQSIAELYDPVSNTWTEADTLTYGRRSHMANLLNNGQVLITTTSLSNPGQSIAELYTPRTRDIYAQKYNSSGTAQWASEVRVNSDDGNRTSSGPNYDHLNPKVKLDSNGDAIVTWQESRNSVYGDDIWAQKLDTDSNGAKMWPNTTTDTWSTAGAMAYARNRHTLTLLNNGKVLVLGSFYSNRGQSVAEVYDPATDTWSTAGTLTFARRDHTATLLKSGKVLVAGSANSDAGQSVAEIYDPATNAWSSAGTMAYSHKYSATTLLQNGHVLLTGSDAGSSMAEIYDPATNTWSTAAAMLYGRNLHTSTLLNNGRVLVVGGNNSNPGDSIAEIYDPASDTWTEADAMTYDRYGQSATLLNNGQVIVLGGGNTASLSIAEIYDPATDTWSTTATATYGRTNGIAELLNDGRVLITGGGTGANGSIAEIYNPATDTWSTADTTTYAHDDVQTVLLNNGQVLAVGQNPGIGDAGSSIAELYLPAGDMQVSNDGSPTNGYGLPNPEHPDVKGILGEQRNPVLAIDSSNNAIVVWEDTRHGAIQNWGLSFDEGDPATTDSEYTWWQTNVNLGANGTCNGGGGFSNSCAAMSALASKPIRIMGQKLVSSDGDRQWGDDLDAVNKNNPEDLGMSRTGDTNLNPNIEVDSSCGAGSPCVMVTWESNSAIEAQGGNLKKESNIYAQKFNSSGTPLWGQSWSNAGTMAYGRTEHSSTLLNNGQVLIVGQSAGIGNAGQSIAELYDPATNTWSTADTLTYARSGNTSTLLNNGQVLVTGGPANPGRSIAELYDPVTDTWSNADTLTYGRVYHAATLLNNGQVLVTGQASGVGDAGSSIAELYDPVTDTWSNADTLTYGRSLHTATMLNNGRVLVVGTGLSNPGRSIAELYDPTTDTWSNAGTLTYERRSHSATLLNSGQVLIVGTALSSPGKTIPELYDPVTNTWSTASTNIYARSRHNANLLNSGRVLIASSYESNAGQSVAELYDPVTNTWSTVGTMNYGRYYFSATLLNSGQVLVTGGTTNPGESIAELYSVDEMINSGVDLAEQRHPSVTLDSSDNLIFAWQGMRGSGQGGGRHSGDSDRGGGNWQIYGMKTSNPDSGNPTDQWPNGTADNWSTADTMTYSRVYTHTSTLLNNGQVLLVGQDSLVGDAGQSIAEIYDPGNDNWSIAGTTSYIRANHTSTLLNNGQVLLVGQDTLIDDAGQSIAEIYDPATNSWSNAGATTYGRAYHTATLLKNGQVLVTGSGYGNAGQSVAELYNPSTDTWSTADTTTYARTYHTATLLNNGQVLVAGSGLTNAGRSVAELYNPTTNTWSTANTMAYPRRYNTATLLNNGQVLVIGTDQNSAGRSIAELYDPATNSWSTAGTMAYGRYWHSATLLNNGQVLVAGASLSNAGQSIAELYDPTTDTWSIADTMTYGRYGQTATLLNNGKVFVSGSGLTNPGRSIAEIYLPSGELALSHDFGLAGDQTHPEVVTDGTDIYATWQDNRSFAGTSTTTDSNVFMQKFDTNGEPQWPAASTTGGYTSPYNVSDVRVDTYANGKGTHYSGTPSLGGITGTLGDSTKRIVIAYEDNSNVTGAASGDCGYTNTNSEVRICGQSYDVNEQNMTQTTGWDVHFHASSPSSPDIDVYTDITEWDGEQAAKSTSAQNWGPTCSPACPSIQTESFATPPSSTVGNVTMRRLKVRFVRNSGSVTISYDDTTYESRLDIGDSGDQDAIGTHGGSTSKNISATSDSLYDVHLIYVDGSDDVQHKKYDESGGSWGSANPVDNGGTANTYVTASFDTGASEVYAIYVRSNVIYYNKWGQATTPTTGNEADTADTNFTKDVNPAHLTSNFSGNSHIFVEWTDGSGSPYNVRWEYIIIPEYLWLFFAIGPLLPKLIRRSRKKYRI